MSATTVGASRPQTTATEEVNEFMYGMEPPEMRKCAWCDIPTDIKTLVEVSTDEEICPRCEGEYESHMAKEERIFEEGAFNALMYQLPEA